MNPNLKIQRLVQAALLSAFTCIATMIIKIQTPTMGYIHMGDALVLICGFYLNGLTGALAAGVGSMFSDLFSGYILYVPGTFFIKAGTAYIAGFLYHKWKKEAPLAIPVLFAGIPAELFMIVFYFLYETGLVYLSGSGTSDTALLAAATSALASVPFNIVQGIFGVIVAILLSPILRNIKRNQ